MICFASVTENVRITRWRIIRHEYTPKHYSQIKCLRCGCVWITRANYVEQTPNKDGQKRLFDYEKSNIERQQRK